MLIVTEPTESFSSPDTSATLPQHRVRSTRTSGSWTAVIAAIVVLLLLLIFILQNGQRIKIDYLGATGHLPLGVALLFAAVAGGILVALFGIARLVQLRRVAKRHSRADAR